MKGKMNKQIERFAKTWLCIGLVAAIGIVCRARAQNGGAKFVVDPNWPKPLPGKWVIGQVSGVCVDPQDHGFIVNRNDMTDKEAEGAQQAPPYIEFDPDGNVVNTFGDWKVVPNVTHGCALVTRLLHLPMAILWRSILKAMFMWPRQTGAGESRNSGGRNEGSSRAGSCRAPFGRDMRD